jgi:hypothetical protein
MPRSEGLVQRVSFKGPRSKGRRCRSVRRGWRIDLLARQHGRHTQLALAFPSCGARQNGILWGLSLKNCPMAVGPSPAQDRIQTGQRLGRQHLPMGQAEGGGQQQPLF